MDRPWTTRGTDVYSRGTDVYSRGTDVLRRGQGPLQKHTILIANVIIYVVWEVWDQGWNDV